MHSHTEESSDYTTNPDSLSKYSRVAIMTPKSSKHPIKQKQTKHTRKKLKGKQGFSGLLRYI